jgi:hypothetical protein
MLAAIAAALAAGFLTLAVAKPDTGTLLPGLLFAAAALGCAIPLAVAFVRRVRRAEIRPDRVVWWAADGEHDLRWEDVESVHRFERITGNGRSGWYQTALTITGRRGEKVVFDHSLSDFAGLADQAQRLSARHLLARKEAECRQGAVQFGPLTLRADGVSHGGKRHCWNEIEYAVSRGFLTIVPAGDKFGWQDRVEVALADIPNVLVLLELMARLGKPPTDPARVIPKGDRARLSRMRE